MYTRRGKKGNENSDPINLAEKHKYFVKKMQNPSPVRSFSLTGDQMGEVDLTDGNVNGALNRSFSVDELPDGSHISPAKVIVKDRKSVKDVEYIGSFAVEGDDQTARAEYVRTQLAGMREVQKSKPVLLVISLSGIKVCSSDGESVYMAHALKRISYATCDPDHAQFSFLAREPKGHTNTQFCHAFVTRTPDEAEELNTTIGAAFQLAYAEQREALAAPGNAGAFNALIERQLSEQQQRSVELRKEREEQLKNRLSQISTPTVEEKLAERRELRRRQAEEDGRRREEEARRGKNRTSWAKQIVGRTRHKDVLPSSPSQAPTSPGAAPTSSEGGDQHAPTDSPAHPPVPQKFRSIEEIRSALDAGELRSYGSPVMTLKETIDTRYELNGGTEEGDGAAEGEPVIRPGGGGGGGGGEPVSSSTPTSRVVDLSTRPLPATPPQQEADALRRGGGSGTAWKRGLPGSSEDVVDARRLSGRYQNASPVPGRGACQQDDPGVTPATGTLYQGPPTPLRYDSAAPLASRDPQGTPLPPPPEQELLNSPWYQSGLPRDVALEILSQQEIGSFIVRDSASHRGCYALSVKVPKYDNPAGISHYLIQRTHNGMYRLKGVEKEWCSLSSLVAHHTVMPELLPVVLRLPRTANNPTFRPRDPGDDLGGEPGDDDLDPEYSRLAADFSHMMTQLKM